MSDMTNTDQTQANRDLILKFLRYVLIKIQ